VNSSNGQVKLRLIRERGEKLARRARWKKEFTLLCAMDIGTHKIADRPQDAIIDFVLGLPTRHELTLGDEQRMVSTFDNVEFICRFHFPPNAYQHVQGAEPVARSLHEQNRRCQSAKHVCPQLCPIATTAERVTKADYGRHNFFQRKMAPHPCPKTFSDKNRRPAVLLAGLNQRFAMRVYELREWIGTFPSFLHIRIVEKGNGADRAQPLRPMLHPWMPRGRAGTMSKYKDRPFHTDSSLAAILLAKFGPQFL